jgi:hypothetical protein
VAWSYNRVLLVREAFMPQAVKPQPRKHHLQSRRPSKPQADKSPLSPKRNSAEAADPRSFFRGGGSQPLPGNQVMQNASAQVSGAPAFRTSQSWPTRKYRLRRRQSRWRGALQPDRRWNQPLRGGAGRKSLLLFPVYFWPSEIRIWDRNTAQHALIKGQRHQGNKPPFWR